MCLKIAIRNWSICSLLKRHLWVQHPPSHYLLCQHDWESSKMILVFFSLGTVLAYAIKALQHPKDKRMCPVLTPNDLKSRF